MVAAFASDAIVIWSPNFRFSLYFSLLNAETGSHQTASSATQSGLPQRRSATAIRVPPQGQCAQWQALPLSEPQGSPPAIRLVALLGGTAAAWPLAVRAQQPAKLPTIGFLGSLSQSAQRTWTAAFAQRMREHGWIEDRTVAHRWAEGRPERAAEIAAEFVRLKVDALELIDRLAPPAPYGCLRFQVFRPIFRISSQTCRHWANFCRASRPAHLLQQGRSFEAILQ
jgi:hypothetical protein